MVRREVEGFAICSLCACDPFVAGLAVCYHNTTSCHTRPRLVVVVLVGGRRYVYLFAYILFIICALARLVEYAPEKAFPLPNVVWGFLLLLLLFFIIIPRAAPGVSVFILTYCVSS